MTTTKEIKQPYIVEAEYWIKLLDFVKICAQQSCCNICDCVSCEATKVLREIGELNAKD